MGSRRKLIEGVKADPAVEQEFVRTGKAKPTPSAQPAEEIVPPRDSKRKAPKAVARVPLTTRIRSDYAEALKRASLERQLQRIEPNTMVDILEEALEPWLRKNGYLH